MTTSIISISNKSKLKKIFIRAGTILFWLLLWHTLHVFVNDTLMLPSPAQTLESLFRLSKTAAFWESSLFTLLRVSLGCVLGILSGLVLGIATARSCFLYELFRPLLTLIKSTPVASFIILALVWMPRNGIPSFIAFLMVIPIVWSNINEGLRSTPADLLEMAAVFKLGTAKKIRVLYVPHLMPFFLSSVTSSLGLAWKAGIAAEVICIPARAIGTELSLAKTFLESPDLFAWTATVIILSVVFEKTALLALKRFQGKSGGVIAND